MNEQFKLPGIDWGADVTGEQNLEDQRISMAYELGHLTFAELLLLGTHIPGSNQVIDEEIIRREYQIREMIVTGVDPDEVPQARLGDPEE
jgi:hypothetical protein